MSQSQESSFKGDPLNCPKCEERGLPRCKHFIHRCKIENCKKKPFKNGYCSCHIPKVTKPSKPSKDPLQEFERQERIRRVDEAKEARKQFIADEIERLKSLEDYSNPDRHLLEEFLMKIAMEEEDEQIRLEEEFEETMNFYQQQFKEKYGTPRRRSFASFSYLFEDNSSSSKKSKKKGSGSSSDPHGATSAESSSEDDKSKKDKKIKMPFSIRCLFEHLEIVPTRNVQEVRLAYRRAAVRCHPDKNAHRAAEATAQFQALSSAYEEIVAHLEGRNLDEEENEP